MPRRICPAAALVLALMLVPASAAAQKDAFINAFIDFHSALAGTYGDEGPTVVAALDRMATSLAVWETEDRETESTLKTRSTDAPSDLALFYLDAGRLDEALEAIDAAIGLDPKRAGFHMFRGVILDALNREAETLKALTIASNLDAADPVIAYLVASRLALGPAPADLERQIETLLEAYERTSRDSRAPFIRVGLVADRAADTPRFSPASYADGFALLAAGRYREAMTRFRDAVTRDPMVADLTARSGPMAEGIAALRAGRYDPAIEALDEAVATVTASSEAHRMLGTAYGANGNHEKSVEHLEMAIRLAPSDERARITLGRELLEAGRADAAERVFRDTLEVLPTSGLARWALVDLYARPGRGLDAVAELEAAASLTVVAGKGHLYFRLADLSHQMQRYEQAAEALSERARLMPNEAGAHKDLGLAYYRLGRPREALVELLMTSLLGLEDAETLAVMGQLHLNAARHTTAESLLRRATALDPASTLARYALGTTLLRLGKTAEAKLQLAEFERLRTAALEDKRRTFDRELREREADLRKQESGR